MTKKQKVEFVINKLEELLGAGEENADIYALMGYNTRKMGKWKKAFKFYEKALEIDPNHIQALEYYGEGLVDQGNMEKAQEMLTRLGQICMSCSQYRALENVIAGDKSKAAKPGGKW